MVYNMGSGILRAVGDSRNPLYFLIVSSVTNIILDMLFVIVFHMGIAGVGWATLIAQTISAVLTMLLLMRTKEEYQVKLKHIRFHKHMLYEIVRLGLPSGLQNAIVPFPMLSCKATSTPSVLWQWQAAAPTPRSTALPYFRL